MVRSPLVRAVYAVSNIACASGGGGRDVECSGDNRSSCIGEVRVRVRIRPMRQPGGVRNRLRAAIGYVISAIDLVVRTLTKLNKLAEYYIVRRSIQTDRLVAAAEREANIVDCESQ